MDTIAAFLDAIPKAATSPLAMVMYLATLGAWVYVKVQVDGLRILLARIDGLPDGERAGLVEQKLGRRIPVNITPEEFIKLERQRLILYGFIAVLVTIVIVFAMAIYDGSKARDRADNLYDKLGSPSSQFMSSANVLKGGEQQIFEDAAAVQQGAGEDIGAMQEQIDKDRMADPNLNNLDATTKNLEARSPGAKLQRDNRSISKAAAFLDSVFVELADCFRRVDCAAGDRFDAMCRQVRQFDQEINAANRAAKVPGITYDTTGGSSMLDNGALDAFYEEVKAPNIAYLASAVCH